MSTGQAAMTCPSCFSLKSSSPSLPLSSSLVHLLAPAPPAESLAGDPREVGRVSSYFPTSQLLGQLPLGPPRIPVDQNIFSGSNYFPNLFSTQRAKPS